MNINFKILRTLLFCFIFLTSCNQKENQTIITGSIPNLPDGVLYLYDGNSNNRIDSVTTRKGSFILNYKWKNNSIDPVYLGLDHVDKKGVVRPFCYPPSAKFKGRGYSPTTFFSDSIVTLKGSIRDFKKLTEKLIFVTVPEIKAGYQTNALFHTDGDLFENINKDSFKKIVLKIKEYPNSFHLLHQINNKRNSFSASQTKYFLSLFNGEINNGETFKNLQDYNEKRFNEKELTLPMLTDNKGKETEILDVKFKKHLVVFWASWCGPCRQEIPSLKKMHSKYKNNIEFVSISTDVNSSFWQKALAKEQMSWKQLIINDNSKDHEILEILFQLNQSVPYIVLVDNNMKVLKSHLGSMNEVEIDNFIKSI